MTACIAMLCLLASAAAADPSCQMDARNLDRELTLRGQELSPADRAAAELRLNRNQGLCDRDPQQAQHDLEQLRRDIIQQATRPDDAPGLPPTGIGRR